MSFCYNSKIGSLLFYGKFFLYSDSGILEKKQTE